MSNVLHIVEPTLSDQAGHCFSFVQSILAVARPERVEIELWVRRNCSAPLSSPAPLRVHRVFGRAGRRVQAWWLYRRLLRTGERVFLSTASRTDLAILSLASPAPIATPGRVYIYMHWFRPSASRMRTLARVARQHPGLETLCSTDSVESALREAGFSRIRRVPYPRSATGTSVDAIKPPSAASALLYAGAARADKGFPTVVDLVALLRERGLDRRVCVQASPTRKGRHDAAMKAAVDRLRAIGYPGLEILSSTLDSEAFSRQFAGAVTLQPYLVDEFADRISGITLDALAAGSPVVVPAGTWMARQVERFGCGVAVDGDIDAERLLAAADVVIDDWEHYASRAADAGGILSAEHAPIHVLDVLLGGTDPGFSE